MKLIDFDPNAEEFKFLTNVHAIGDTNYFIIRAVEELRNQPSKKNLIMAARLIMLAVNELER